MSSAKYKGSLANERVGGKKEGAGEEEEGGGKDKRWNESKTKYSIKFLELILLLFVKTRVTCVSFINNRL